MRSTEEQQSLNVVKSLLQTFNLSVTATEDQHSHYDLLAQRNVSSTSTGTSTGLHIEVKHRRINAQEFLNYRNPGFVIEKPKYDFLMSVNGRYICTFEFPVFYNSENFSLLNVVIIWKLGKNGVGIPEFKDEPYKQSTDFNNENYRDKEVAYLTLDNCKIYTSTSTNDWNSISQEKLIQDLRKLCV